jgi:hypothetical protein
LIHFEELGGLLELFLFFFAALGLDFAELVECPFDLAGEAMLVHANSWDWGLGAGDLGLGTRERDSGRERMDPFLPAVERFKRQEVSAID